MHFVWSTLAVAGAVAIGRLLNAITPFPNVSMIFLMAVLLPAVRFGIVPAIYASVLSFLAYNFFFIEPIHTFTVTQPHELLALAIFLFVAVMTSALAGRVREQARIAVNRMRAMRRLYEFTRRLSGLATLDSVAEGAASEINISLNRPAVVLLDRDGDLVLSAAWPPEDTLDSASMTEARRAFANDEPGGSATALLLTVPWFFVPLRASEGPIGVVGIAPGSAPLDSEARALLDTLAGQAAAALERASLSREMVNARTAAETERVRNTLLASISHDFRTPLSSILGSATSLLEYGDKLDAKTQKDLLEQIKHEAQGVDEMVRNLLAITRIDAGALELRHDWIDLREIAERIVNAARRRGVHRTFEINCPEDMPLVQADATLAEQALGNVVGNAIVHTSDTTTIAIDAAIDQKSIAVAVTDDGPGIPPQSLPHVFDKFVQARQTTGIRADGGQGSGLGLAIAKGIMEAHGGMIAAQSPYRNGRGTRVTLTFPRGGAS